MSKTYRLGEVEVPALRGIDLELRAGELVVILGASGSGKSTLLNILGGLDIPTHGEVCYRDHVLSNATDRALTRYRREHIGFVFQFFNLLPSLTALENVELVTEIAADAFPAREVLERVGLGDRLHHFPSQLSGGEQQRVAIARALAKRPDVLFCDEPTGSLDYPTGKRVLQVLEQANRELGTLVVVITHNVAIAAMANRVVHMSSGDHPLRAQVRLVEPYGFTKISALGVEEKRTNVILDFVDPPGSLGDGYRVVARIITWSAQRVLQVPMSAIFRCGSDWCVFAVDGGRARMRHLLIGHRNDEAVEVLSGVRAGEQVVAHPPNELGDGDRVSVRLTRTSTPRWD